MNERSTGDAGGDETLVRIHDVVRETIRRRHDGELLTDEAVLRAHPDLLPGLRRELRKLGVVEAARSVASATPGASDGESAPPHPPCGPAPAPAGYEIIRELHRGGQGVVYEAIQQATERRVAIKVLRHGLTSGTRDRARFEREIQVLSRLTHPNIVTIYDSGSDADRLYYVMEYVDGLPIDSFGVGSSVGGGLRNGWNGAAQAAPLPQGRNYNHRAPAPAGSHRSQVGPAPIVSGGEPRPVAPGIRFAIRKRRSGARSSLDAVIRLFIKVSDVVHAAHLKGFIHRDLKPGNILVDASGEPHLLDFGLAKFHPETAPDGPTVTAAGEFVGSMPWSSPEQVSGDADVDVRSDIYSLGVILYHLVTGGFPYAVSGSTRDVANNICEAAPTTPSQINPDVDADLETIVLKCLHKARERRYQSAGDLSSDLRRYLNGEPIQARADSTWYVLRKTLLRHKLAAVLGAALLLLSITATLALGLMLRHARGQSIAAGREAQRAVAAENEARAQADTSREVTEFLVGLFQASDPDRSSGRDVTVREVLDVGAERLLTELEDQPLTRASLADAVGRVYHQIGLFDRARSLLELALRERLRLRGPSDAAVAESEIHLAALAYEQGAWVEAEALLRKALRTRRTLRGDDDPEVAAVLRDLGEIIRAGGDHGRAEELFREALEIGQRHLDEDHPDVVSAMRGLSTALRNQRKFTEAETYARTVLAYHRSKTGGDSTHLADALSELGWVTYRLGRYDESLVLHEEALAIRRRLLGDHHAEVAEALNAIASVWAGRGDAERSNEVRYEALEISRRALGPEHPSVAVQLVNLGISLMTVGDLSAAEATFAEALAIERKTMPGHPRIAGCLNLLGRSMLEQGRCADAETTLREALAESMATGVREDDLVKIEIRIFLAAALICRDQFGEAEKLLFTAMGELSRIPPASLEGVKIKVRRLREQQALERLVELYTATGRAAAAEQYRHRMNALLSAASE
ncbi:MAG: serine/threonine protein kinase [Phycisphaerales bacterium]|nr:MAG: serine/threonine protein kinase [Phycisphaerales bacterium]